MILTPYKKISWHPLSTRNDFWDSFDHDRSFGRWNIGMQQVMGYIHWQIDTSKWWVNYSTLTNGQWSGASYMDIQFDLESNAFLVLDKKLIDDGFVLLSQKRYEKLMMLI